MSAPRPTSTRVPRWLRIVLPAALILIWVGAGAVGGPYFGKVEEVATNDQSSFLPQSADATQVNERLSDFLGEGSIPAVVVVEGDGELSEDQLADIQTLADDLAQVPGVLDEISPPLPSEDGQAVQIFVPIDSDGEVRDTVVELRKVVSEDLPDGLEAWVTGPAGFTADLAEGFLGIDGLLLIVALGAVFVILVVVYRSPLLPVLVLMTSVFALCAALLVVWWLAKAEIVVLNGQVQGILFILVIGAATDYALLYVARFREAIAQHLPRWEAMRRAWRGAWEPIVASGGTVIAGLLCLLLSDLASNRALGPIASIGIVFAMLSALTFLPALLVAFGKAAFWPFIPKGPAAELADDMSGPVKGIWARLARFVSRHARPVWIISTVVLLVGCAGVFQLKADGVPTSDFVLGYSESREGQTALADHFPAGSGSPAYVLVDEADAADALGVLEDAEGVDSTSLIVEDSATGQAPVSLEDGALAVTAFGPPGTPAPEPTVSDGQLLFSVTLADAADSDAAEDTIRDLRDTFAADFGEGAVLVGGETAIDVDTNDTSIRDRTVIIPVILAVVLVILMLLLRSILAPVLLILSTVLSFGTALGVSALVFNHVFDFPGADPAVPLYGFVFLVALGIDYNIFLMSRVREESLVHGTRAGIRRGLISTGGVITSAGLVLAATFAALGVIPILFLAQIAFIVAFGVLLDTFVVRSLLVPALGLDIGRAIWWPSKLSRTDAVAAAPDAGGDATRPSVAADEAPATRRSLRRR